MKFNQTQKDMIEALSDADNGLKVKEVGKRIGRSRQTVSKHYPELVRAGIVEEIDSGQSTLLKLKDATRGSVVSTAVEDTSIIDNTSLDNASTTKEMDTEKTDFLRATAYRSRGLESIFEKTIEIGGEKHTVIKLLGKILKECEEEVERELERQAKQIYSEILEKYSNDDSYNIRDPFKIDSNRNNIVKPIVKGSELQIDRVNPSINFDPIENEGRPRPEYLYLMFQPYLIDLLGGEPDKAREIIEERVFTTTDRFNSVLEDLDGLSQYLNVLREGESEMLQEFQKRVEERKEGKMMLTVTRTLGVVPTFYGEIDFEEEEPEIANP